MRTTQLNATCWHLEWFERMPERLVLEQQVMQDRFPQFQLLRDGLMLYWIGKLTTNRGNVYQLVVKYLPSFPNDPPQAYPIDPAIAVYKSGWSGALKHQYADGRLCLYYPADRTLTRETTAATVVAMAAAWLFAYESWLQSGKTDWPGNEYD